MHGQGVNKPVAAGEGHVVCAEARPAEVGHVVRQSEVRADALSADAPCPLGVDDDLLLDHEERLGAEPGTGASGVLGCDELRKGACTAVAGKVEHSGAERGECPARRRHPGPVQLVEAGDERLVGLGVARLVLRVPCSDPEVEPMTCVAVSDLRAGQRCLAKQNASLRVPVS